ncbi:MAG: hypothetical protein RBS50_15735 [Phenylobacterium sp.]|jgi:hypothetical protein|uniref:hypothetical protein n=1 Tax=Phenylobacterium sp. TaxID=1871053 RepID=UPI002A2DB419|nr:hypothetical protein [Phenylobacterium sp.]MDD3838175.1 hypothetical protein [Phenylobacterium sp.]MDX9999408.1 hypothetical protein [Phenylobacterium sp.]
MRPILMAAGLAAAFALTGCGDSSAKKAEETAAAQAPARKPFGRQRQLYQGQEPIVSVQSGTIAANGPNLTLTVQGTAAGPGYTRGSFLPRINPAAPKDGLYEVDVVAIKPADGATGAPEPIEIKGEWPGYPADRLKGVIFMAGTNEITVMLPETAAPAAQ